MRDYAARALACLAMAGWLSVKAKTDEGAWMDWLLVLLFAIAALGCLVLRVIESARDREGG